MSPRVGVTLSGRYRLQRLIATGGQIPPPLENSPKCPRCSLAPICLPDELHYLHTGETPPRPLAVAGNPALPMYVQARGAKVAKKGDVLEVSVDDEAQLIETVIGRGYRLLDR